MQINITKRFVITGVLTVLTFFATYLLIRPTAESVMREFYEGERYEGWIAAPLKNHTSLVKWRVIEDIADKNMRYRAYAMGFLGECNVTEALPALLAILDDQTEKAVFRADALEAIFLLDPTRAMALADRYAEREDRLGYIAKHVKSGKLPWTDFEDTDNDDVGAVCSQ